MYQLVHLKMDHELHLDVLLDHTKIKANGEPHEKFVVHLTFPLPPPGTTMDDYIVQCLTHAEQQLQANLTIRSTPLYDPLAKWKDYQWSGIPTIPTRGTKT